MISSTSTPAYFLPVGFASNFVKVFGDDPRATDHHFDRAIRAGGINVDVTGGSRPTATSILGQGYTFDADSLVLMPLRYPSGWIAVAFVVRTAGSMCYDLVSLAPDTVHHLQTTVRPPLSTSEPASFTQNTACYKFKSLLFLTFR